MTDSPPPEQTTTTDPPPTPTEQSGEVPTQQSAGQPEPTYSADDLAAAASSLGCHPWDVAGIFSAAGMSTMTMTQFQSALQAWQTTPVPTTGG